MNAKKIAVITGTSTGIGFEAVLALAREGYYTYATMRDIVKADKIMEIAQKENLKINVLKLDVENDSSVKSAIKQIIDTLAISQKQAFKKVVYIEYPKKDVWTIALVTGESKDLEGNEYYQIFVPTTPNPTSGFMLYIKKENTKETNMNIDEGLKIIISGGMLAPETNAL